VKCTKKGVYPVLTVRGIYKKNLPLVLSFFATAATSPSSTDCGQTSSTSDTVTATSTTDSGHPSTTTDTVAATSTTDSGQPSTTTDTVAAATTDGPQSTVSSGDTPANTTDNQELLAAGSDTSEGDPCNLVKGEMALIDFCV